MASPRGYHDLVERRFMSASGTNAKCDWVRKCLLFGVDRTYRGHHETDASDPKRTFKHESPSVAVRWNS
jgi:hypothetical protein